jgi:hypothetical protein
VVNWPFGAIGALSNFLAVIYFIKGGTYYSRFLELTLFLWPQFKSSPEERFFVFGVFWKILLAFS